MSFLGLSGFRMIVYFFLVLFGSDLPRVGFICELSLCLTSIVLMVYYIYCVRSGSYWLLVSKKIKTRKKVTNQGICV